MTNITDKIMIVLFVAIVVGIVVFLMKDELCGLTSFIRKKGRDTGRTDEPEEKKMEKKPGLTSPFDQGMKTMWSRGPLIEIFVKETGETIHHTMTEKEISIGGRFAKNATIKIDSPFISRKHLIIKNLTDEDGPFTRIINCSKHSMTEHKVKVGGKNRWAYMRNNESTDVDEGEESFWIGDAARVKVTVPKFAHMSSDEKTRIAGDDGGIQQTDWREQYCGKDEPDFPELAPEKNPFDYL